MQSSIHASMLSVLSQKCRYFSPYSFGVYSCSGRISQA